MPELFHIVEVCEFQELETQAFKYVKEEQYQRFITQLRQEFLVKQQNVNIVDELGKKAWKMLSNFVNNSNGIEKLILSVDLDTEDENVKIDIPHHSMSVYLYYNESNIEIDNYDEAYLYYEAGHKQIITNNTTKNIAKIVSELLNK